MPEGKVTISAVYSRITNPNTVSACLTILAIIVLMYLGTFLVLKHEKYNWKLIQEEYKVLLFLLTIFCQALSKTVDKLFTILVIVGNI